MLACRCQDKSRWADVAQLAEQGFCKPQVAGSSPIVGSSMVFALYDVRGGMPEWLKGADCKSVAKGYVGSNPTLPTSIYAVRLLMGRGDLSRPIKMNVDCMPTWRRGSAPLW